MFKPRIFKSRIFKPSGIKHITLALLVLLLIAGCGQKGDLYLPQPDANFQESK